MATTKRTGGRSRQESREQVAVTVTPGTKARIADALAQARILDGEEAPAGITEFVQAAIDARIDTYADRFSSRR